MPECAHPCCGDEAGCRSATDDSHALGNPRSCELLPLAPDMQSKGNIFRNSEIMLCHQDDNKAVPGPKPCLQHAHRQVYATHAVFCFTFGCQPNWNYSAASACCKEPCTPWYVITICRAHSATNFAAGLLCRSEIRVSL